MIKNITYLVCFLSFAGFVGCKKDLLDKLPTDTLSDKIVWTDPNAAEQFINGIYGQIISGFERGSESDWGNGVWLLDAASDNGDETLNGRKARV